MHRDMFGQFIHHAKCQWASSQCHNTKPFLLREKQAVKGAERKAARRGEAWRGRRWRWRTEIEGEEEEEVEVEEEEDDDDEEEEEIKMGEEG